jgi:DNA invertase Pin-like site-specific DNA recombinase
VTAPFDIYVRVSEVGGRKGDSFGSPAEQESGGRAWIEQEGLEVGEVVTELDVSGKLSADDRELGRLIRKIENGESAGIAVRDEKRFARDVIAGAIALQRIEEAGGRLRATATGFDSKNLSPEQRAWFHATLAFAQAERERNAIHRRNGRVRAAERGVYLGGQPPVGFWKDWENGGRLTPHPELAALVVQTFERRANGETFSSLARWLKQAGGEIEVPNPKNPKRLKGDEPETVRPLAGVTENGVRHMISNTAYLGEAERPRKDDEPPEISRDGKPKSTTTIRNAHEPIVTAGQWEAAQGAGGPAYRNNGRWSSQVRLSGLVYCESGHRLKTGGGGSGKYKHAIYTCTTEGCKTRATVGAERLDNWIENLLQDAVLAGEPHVTAVLAGDDRYQRALDAVAEATRELDAYRAEIKVSDVGAEQWKRDVRVRTAAVEAARTALKAIPKPTAANQVIPISEQVWAATSIPERRELIEATLRRESNSRFVARVVVRPVGQGSRVPVSERAELFLVGADKALDPATVQPVGDPETMKLLTTAHATEAEEAA